MSTEIHRHDLSDEMWEVLKQHLPKQKGEWGGNNANDNRVFINGVFWILRTGAPWRDMPSDYGNWNSVAKRFRRWVEKRSPFLSHMNVTTAIRPIQQIAQIEASIVGVLPRPPLPVPLSDSLPCTSLVFSTSSGTGVKVFMLFSMSMYNSA